MSSLVSGLMQRRSYRSSGRRGFTLVETGLAIIIVATSMLAMVAAHEAFVQQNQWGERASQAARLGGEIRERSMVLPVSDPVTGTATWGAEAGEGQIFDWDDMDDFDGLDVSGYGGDGPIDASWRRHSGDGWLAASRRGAVSRSNRPGDHCSRRHSRSGASHC